MAENSVEVIENDLRRILGVGQHVEEISNEDGRTNQARGSNDNQEAANSYELRNFSQSPLKPNFRKFQGEKFVGKADEGQSRLHHEDDAEKIKKKKKKNKKIGNPVIDSESPKTLKENKKSKRKKTKWEAVDLKTTHETPPHSQQKTLFHQNSPPPNKFPTTEGFYHNPKPVSSSQQCVPAVAPFQQMRPPPDVQEFLEKNFIHPLKKRFSKFPRALFFCRLCDYHCDTITVCERHIKDSRHQKNRDNRELEITLHSLPDPYEPHAKVVNDVISNVAQQYGLSDCDIKEREGLVQEMKDFTLDGLKDCQLRLYGSSLSKFGLKTSDVNIDLVVEDNSKPSDVLMAVFEKVKTWPYAENVQSDFTAKIPSILFREKRSQLNCMVNLNNAPAFSTALLLSEYISIDPRVRVLGAAFRYWAEICLLDKQYNGTLPAHSFPIMVIYYLQQCQPPVLPVLHEMVRNENEIYLPASELKENWTCNNTQSIGELWIALLKFYAVTFKTSEYVVCIQQSKLIKRSERGWSSKRLALEDPFSNKRNLARSISNHLVAEYIFDRFKTTYKYFGIPQTLTGPLFDKLLLVTLTEHSEKKNRSGALLLDALEIIASKSNNVASDSKQNATSKNKKVFIPDPSMVVTIPSQSKQEKTKDSKNGKNLAVKELSEIEGTENANEEKLDKSFQDGELNCSREDAESDHSLSTHGDESEHESCIMNSLMEALDDDFELRGGDENEDINTISDGEEGEKRQRNISEISENVDSEMDSEDDETEEKVMEKETENFPVECCNGTESNEIVVKKKLPLELEEKLKNLTAEELLFKFHQMIFTCGKVPSVFCCLCQQEGHLKHDCPEERLPPLMTLPPIDLTYMSAIDKICHRIYKDNNPNKVEMNGRNSILRDLQTFIKRIYPDAKLELFGSSCNGFGFARSDLDICLTFENKNAEDVKFIPIIENLSEKLKKHKQLTNVVAITTAKVPIVKFTHRPSSLEGDISLYNTLAQHNTRMLNMYSEIDVRVKILGYVMKVFAKLCNIGDASRGSLSSYAYILMVIYFLQQRDPPVIPVLQELYDKSKMQPKRMVDGWNAWFYDDKESLSEIWPHIGKNTETVAQLWLGLLRFYTENFSFQELVVSIRQYKPLTRFEKLWNSKCIAIEDPFDLQHNLGAGVSRKMNIYIMKALIRSRQLFGTPIPREHYETNPMALHHVLFNTNNLADGAPPNDRGCRSCGKIGHIVKHCPRRRGVRNKGDLDANRERNPIDRRNNRDAFNRNRQQMGPGMNLRQGGIQNDIQNMHMGLMRPQMMASMHGQMHNQNLRSMGGLLPLPMMNNMRQPAPPTVGQRGFNQFNDSRQLQHLEKISSKMFDSGVRKTPITHTVAALPTSRPIVHPGVSQPNQKDLLAKKSSRKFAGLSREISQHHEIPICQRSTSCVVQQQSMSSFTELPIAKSKSSDSAALLSSEMKNPAGENMEISCALTRSPSMTPPTGRNMVGLLIRPGVAAPPGFTNLNVNFRMPHDAQLIRGPLTVQETQHLHSGMQQPAFQQNAFMASPPPHLGNYFSNENAKLHQNSHASPFCQIPMNYSLNLVPLVNIPPSTSAVNRFANQHQNNSAFPSQDDVMKNQICFLGERLPTSLVKEELENPNLTVEKKTTLNFISKNDYKAEIDNDYDFEKSKAMGIFVTRWRSDRHYKKNRVNLSPIEHVASVSIHVLKMQPTDLIEQQTNEIFYGRCRRALLCLWVSQPLIVVTLIILLNLNLLHPYKWLSSCNLLISIDLLLVIFILSSCLVFLSVIHICNLAVRQNPTSTHWARYWKVLRPQNVIQIVLYSIVCAVNVKFYLSLVENFDSFLISSTESLSCLNEHYLYCIFNALIIGFWHGVTYFDKNKFLIIFPVIQQTKVARINEAFFRIFCCSFSETFHKIKWLSLFYVFLSGQPLKTFFLDIFELNSCCDSVELSTYSGILNLKLLWITWIATSIAIFNCQFLLLIFNVFKFNFQRFVFPLQRTPETPNTMLLQEALTVVHIPLISYLAALDFRLLSQEKNSPRNHQLYTLSVPGGHPYNWRSVSNPCLYLLNNFLDRISWIEEKVETPVFQSVNFTYHPLKSRIILVRDWLDRKWRDAREKSKLSTVLNFFLSDMPDRIPRNVFADSQPYIWLIEALSFALITAVKENNYGVVQEEFVAVITTIMDLEQALVRCIRSIPVAKCYNPQTQRDFKLRKCLELVIKMALNRLAWDFQNHIEFIQLTTEQKRNLKSRAEFMPNLLGAGCCLVTMATQSFMPEMQAITPGNIPTPPNPQQTSVVSTTVSQSSQQQQVPQQTQLLGRRI
uniref:CCHC-type domain-containing protein n=1 Tax=Strigamia maritima TaxID=126957 RepID=T1JHR9_STRMM